MPQAAPGFPVPHQLLYFLCCLAWHCDLNLALIHWPLGLYLKWRYTELLSLPRRGLRLRVIK